MLPYKIGNQELEKAQVKMTEIRMKKEKWDCFLMSSVNEGMSTDNLKEGEDDRNG